MKRSC